MSNVINLPATGKYETEYVFEGKKVVGVKHPLWPFRIQRKDNKVALVSEDDDTPFGELDSDVFNSILMCWLLIDDPQLIDAANKDNKNE